MWSTWTYCSTISRTIEGRGKKTLLCDNNLLKHVFLAQSQILDLCMAKGGFVFLERFNFFCRWWFIEWMWFGAPFHFIDYSFHATKGCGRHIFGLKFVGKIHDGLLVWILQTIRLTWDEDVPCSPSLLAHPKPLSNLVPKFEMV